MVTNQKIRLRSRINQYFSNDLMFEIERIVSYQVGLDTNVAADMIYEKIKEEIPDVQSIGPGTNRVTFLFDTYCIKVATNDDGVIDNMKEFQLTKELQPFVIRVNELSMNGILAICEYVSVFDLQKFKLSQSEMRLVCKAIADKGFFIGDIGISDVNYLNWGTREDGSICILDFAYAYRMSFKKFTCSCSPMAQLGYDSNYNYLVCKSCGRKITFGEMRSRLSREDVINEIGDLGEIGYVVHGASETVYRDTDKSPRDGDDKLIRKLKEEIEMKKTTDQEEEAEEVNFNAYLSHLLKGEIKL